MKNILITSAGRRVSLVQTFKQTASKYNDEIKIYTADKDPVLAPACYVSDGSFKVSSVKDDCYIDELLEICESKNVGIVIPTIDTCLPVLSRNVQRFIESGIHVMVSCQDFVGISCDKRETFKFFREYGIKFPKAIDISNPTFPIFAKPIDGSGSIGIHVINNEEELSENIKHDSNLLFMEYVDKAEYKEFTIDMYFGKDNHVKCIVPRERIEVRGGEVSKGVTRRNYLVDFLRKRFEFMPGVVGCICIQLFYRENDNDVLGIEINPRFGGGYPLSYHAGANFPQMIMQEYIQGKPLKYTDNWQDNRLMLRYDAEIIL